jgi:hypothetical protein
LAANPDRRTHYSLDVQHRVAFTKVHVYLFLNSAQRYRATLITGARKKISTTTETVQSRDRIKKNVKTTHPMI